MIKEFESRMRSEGVSEATIKSYVAKIEEYVKWYRGSFGLGFQKLFRENILDYISYLQTVKKDNAKTINTKISALIKFNHFLVEIGGQEEMVVNKKDRIRVQEQLITPTKINKPDVERFRQRVLEEEGIKYYCIVAIATFCGLRISEILSIQLNDFNLTTRELMVNRGKGNKMRIVYMNQKVVNSIKEYLRKRNSDSAYLFPSKRSATGKMNPSTINKVFNKYSDIITPHQLRHYCATNMLSSEVETTGGSSRFAIHEVASQLGHANIHTTMRYSHINKDELLEKIDKL